MYKFILILLFTISLNASNPKPYATLGDIIYNNAQKIEKLQFISSFQLEKNAINKYIKELKATRQYGFELEKKKANRNKNVYLNKLRKLSKTNDYYLRNAKTIYSKAMKEKDYKLFSEIVNSGLINLEENKKKIVNYYYKHTAYIKNEGIIKELVDEDIKRKAKRRALRRRYKTKKDLELEKIERIRKNDKLEKLKLEEELQKDLQKRKLEIRVNQEQELNL